MAQHGVGARSYAVMDAAATLQQAARRGAHAPRKLKDARAAARRARRTPSGCCSRRATRSRSSSRRSSRARRRCGRRRGDAAPQDGAVVTPAPLFSNLPDGAPVAHGDALFPKIETGDGEGAARPTAAARAAAEGRREGRRQDGKGGGAADGKGGGAKKGRRAPEFADHGDEDDTAASRARARRRPHRRRVAARRLGEAVLREDRRRRGVRRRARDRLGPARALHGDELKGRLVLVAANLAPKKLAGFPSNGMVLCASDAAHEKVVCVDPPAGAAVGERVALAGLPNAPAEPKQPRQEEALRQGAAPLRDQGRRVLLQGQAVRSRAAT